MTRRRLLSASSRDALFEIPSDSASLERFYILATLHDSRVVEGARR